MIKHCTSPSFELKHYLDLDLIDAQISSTVGAAEQEHLSKEGDKVCITL